MTINVTDRLTDVNNCAGNIHRSVLMVELQAMDTKEKRRMQLLLVIEDMFDGESGQCADKLGVKRPQLSRWITANEDARQGISEDSARSIEDKLGLPRLWLDGVAENHPIESAVADFERTYNSANEEGKKFLRGAIDAAQVFVKIKEVVRKKA